MRRVLIASIAVVLILLLDAFMGGTLRGLARRALSPISGFGASIGGDTFATRSTLQREKAELESKVADLEAKLAGATVLQSENDSLRRLVGIAGSERGITAPIISSLISSPYGTFNIGKGRSEGITAGSVVLIGGETSGFVVGRVAEVGEHTGTVREVLAPLSSIEVVLGDVEAILSGRGGGQGRAEVPRDSKIIEGSAVIAPTLRERALGIVGKVEEDPAGTHKTVHVRLPVSLSEARFVYVVSE